MRRTWLHEIPHRSRAVWPALVLAVFVWSGAPAPAWAQGATVTTLAGTAGVPGFADGAGAAASFTAPGGVACDAAGNIYVADTDNDAVRKITPAGVVSTLVGAAAGLDSPGGVACDTAGNVYIADTYAHVIRKVTAAGLVTVLAGDLGVQGSDDGSGIAARFSYPGGVACDAAGNVYVADTLNNTIRKITPAGEVSTLAGDAAADPGSDDGVGAAARFSGPQGICSDAAGTIHVADTDNQAIRRITPAGVVSTLAGASAGLSYPWGVAADAGAVYVADTDNCMIRRIAPSGEISTLAGAAGEPGSADGAGAAARFDSPRGVACDGSGNIYVADTVNSTIRRVTVDATAPVTTATPPLASSATSGWRNTAQTVTLTATDAGSGVASTSYSIDGGPVLTYSAPFTVSAPGSHAVTYFSTDNAGNVEQPQTGYVNIDAPPVTTATPPLASSATSGWRNTAQTVTLTATDAGSGVASTSYSIDGGPVLTYSAPFTVSAAGSHAVTYFSTDNAGNVEQPQTGYVNIDAPPVTTATPPLASSATSGWRNTAQTVTLTATDAGSGVASTSYSIDGGPVLTYSAPFTVSAPGSHAVTYFSTDNAGNVEQPQTGYVNIDTTVPTTKAQPAAVRAGKTVMLKFRVADAAISCGQATVKIQIKKGGRVVKTVTVGAKATNAALTFRYKAALKKGVYTWRVLATDAAGNKAVDMLAAKLTVK